MALVDAHHRQRRVTLALCLAASMILFVARAAFAAPPSFDCAKATSPLEHTICGSPELAALDETLAASYQRALSSLSADGAGFLKSSQRAWIHHAEQICLHPAVPASERGSPQRRRGSSVEGCLMRQWSTRLQQLEVAGLRLGRLVLGRVDHYELQPPTSGDDTGNNEGPTVHHVGYPFIDSTSPEAREWNRARVPALGLSGPGEDLDVEVIVGCGNAHLLSILVTTSTYGHGAAHGLYGSEAVNTVLTPKIRALVPSDLFAKGSDWQAKLPALFVEAYRRDRPPENIDEGVEQAVRNLAATPDRWLLTPDGLQITFNVYEAGNYASDPGPITVAWDDLAPMLASQDLRQCSVSTLAVR